MNPAPDELVLFIGRFHPVLVHLPIGLIVLVFVLEFLGRWRRFEHASAANGIILALAVPAAAGSALCGWLLSGGGGYDAQLLDWHRWAGVGVAAACAVALVLRWLEHRFAYRLVLTATFATLLVASHLGGSLTHGSDYLTRYAPGPLRGWLGTKPKAATPTGMGAETDKAQSVTAVMSILARTCVGCHGPEKAKGDLRLDSLEAIHKGSKNGPLLDPGKSGSSPLIQRLLLPLAHEDHMPPEGKPQPTPDEIALIRQWVEAMETL